jgi:hypothetical protein
MQTLTVGGTSRLANGDRMFISSDHTETQTANSTYGGIQSGYALLQYLCVNRGGSTPPVAADLTTGASVTAPFVFLETLCESYHYGITYTASSASTLIDISGSGFKSIYLKNCQLVLVANAGGKIQPGQAGTLILDNTTVQFGSTQQGIAGGSSDVPLEILWINTSGAVAGATLPTALFNTLAGSGNSGPLVATLRGVDLSAVTGTLVAVGSSVNAGSKYLFDSCKIASGVTRYSNASVANTRDLVELVNCFDGTNIISESYQPCGALTTEFTITLTGGAADDVGAYSHKLVSNTNIDKLVQPLCSFWMDVENTLVGSSRTATVEIVSSASLNNDEIALYLQYEGTSGSPVATITNSLPGLLTTPSAVPTSSAVWNSSPSTPVYQHLQVTFTPQHAGRVRAQVRLGKASTTVYVNPQITIT